MVDIKEIEAFLSQMNCISSVKVVNAGDALAHLLIDVKIPELESTLPFTVSFDPWYPSKVRGTESIHFKNDQLIKYPHIMEGGSLCLHTISSPDWKEKITSDISQLCEWIKEYYVLGKNDTHFEHLVVEESTVDDCYHSYHYAQPSTGFSAGEMGYAYCKRLIDGSKLGKTIRNFIVSCFHDKRNLHHQTPTRQSPFSVCYNSTDGCTIAPYIFVNSVPGIYGKFIYRNFKDFDSLITQEQRKHIHEYSEWVKERKNISKTFPLFIGYGIPDNKIAWNVAMIDANDLPTIGTPEYIDNRKTGRWLSEFKDMQIKWASTNDISPEYFFGRGCLPAAITEKRILIMGIGAIGSMVATTLVRGGCREIGLYDFDIKQPGNVCRSEYDFLCPTNEKMNDLASARQRISPYANITLYKEHFDEYVKLASQQSSDIKQSVGQSFKDNYDLVFDCTTDDDVMYALEQLKLPIDIVNISMSNHANELVCAFSPSVYEFVRGIYSHTIKNDSSDLFYPTGCWDPTFKASYNDIAAKLQYALKRVFSMLSGQEIKQNFVISEDATGIKFHQW